MTKPDDIDQDAWEIGVRMAGEYLSWLNAGNSTGHLSEHAVAAMADTIARAIMSAKAEEREAILELVSEYVWDDHALAQATDIGRAVHYQSVEIADAIRNRP